MKDKLMHLKYALNDYNVFRHNKVCAFISLFYEDFVCPACQTHGCFGYQMYKEIEMYD